MEYIDNKRLGFSTNLVKIMKENEGRSFSDILLGLHSDELFNFMNKISEDSFEIGRGYDMQIQEEEKKNIIRKYLQDQIEGMNQT